MFIFHQATEDSNSLIPDKCSSILDLTQAQIDDIGKTYFQLVGTGDHAIPN